MAAEDETSRAPAGAIRAPAGAPPRLRAARRRLSVAGAASLAVHALILAGVVLAGLRYPVRVRPPQQEVRVALVLKEQKGAGRPQAGGHRPPQPPAPPAPHPAVKAPATHAAPAAPLPPVPPPQRQARPTPSPAPPAPRAAASPAAPAPPAPPAQSAFQFNLGGTDSETNAIVHGNAIVPARPDDRFRNREPVYPDAAARRGEQGTVILLIHVAPDGRPSAVDILQSSGFGLLDRAARQAVEGWHFLPAIRNGEAVAAAMPLRVVFSLH
jgi:periplasmic protein TonB